MRRRAAAVVNASPLIFLAKLSKLDALGVYDPLLTTPLVIAEVEVGSAKGYREALAVRGIVSRRVLEVREAPPLNLPPPVLDAGEQSVISLATKVARATAVIDDLAAIRAAKHLGVRVRSTPFVLLDNLASGRIDLEEFRSLLDRLLAMDYRISPSLFMELVELGDAAAARQ